MVYLIALSSFYLLYPWSFSVHGVCGLPFNRSPVWEAFIVEFKIILVLALYVSLVLVLSLIQSLLFAILRDLIVLGSLASIATVIASINVITAFILTLSSHMLFNVVVPLHMLRCSILPTFDCRLSPLMLRYKLRSALALLPILIIALFTGNMVRLGLPLTLHTFIQTLTLGLTRVYGILELAGYTLAYITPLLGATRVKLVVALLALTMIMLGAVIETTTILRVSG